MYTSDLMFEVAFWAGNWLKNVYLRFDHLTQDNKPNSIVFSNSFSSYETYTAATWPGKLIAICASGYVCADAFVSSIRTIGCIM